MNSDTSTSTTNYSFLTEGFTYIRQIYESKLGFTRLFKAKRMGKWHILKTLKTEYAHDPVAIGLLKREFEVGYHLSHPNIVQTIDLENVKGVGLSIVMEYIDGQSLREYIQAKKLNRDLIYQIMTEVCLALIYLHEKQVVHRDLKPENIIITKDGQHVKLIDFGHSDPENYALLKHRPGTRKYAAPEHLADDGVVDGRTDIYSVGVILKEMNETLMVPSFWLRQISLRCREFKKEKRYASAADLLKALESRMPRNLMVGGSIGGIAVIVIVLLLFYAMPHVTLSWSPRVTYIHDTLVQTRVDTVQQLADSIQANPITKETGESYQRLADLLKRSKELTVEMVRQNEAVQKDTTIPLSRRMEAENNLFFKVEDAVKTEVNKTIQPEDPQYSIYLNATLGVMEQTFKNCRSRR